MNIIDIQDQLKNFSENQLIKEMQAPSGTAPQFLVLSEIQRRKRVRDDFSKREAANQQTVAQEAVAAAGVPMQGIAGMSEAMAPQSAASEGIGTIMPTSMRQASPDTPAMPMQEGGLVSGLFSNTERGKEISGRDYEIRTGKDGRKYVYKKGTNIMIGSADKLFDNKYDGGVLRANAGMYFDAQGRPTKELIEAMIMQESAGDPLARGSLDEVGIGQLRPSTALMPGYGVSSMFPEISSQIGEGKMFSTADEAYAANKELIDSTLENPDRSRAFMGDYLSALRANADSDERAIAAYNMGLGGARKLDDPTQFGYVTDVASKMSAEESPSMMDGALDTISTAAGAIGDAILPSAAASTLDSKEPEAKDDDGNWYDFLFESREDRLERMRKEDPDGFKQMEEQSIIKRAQDMAKLPPSRRKAAMDKLYKTNPELAMKVDELLPAATQGGGMKFDPFTSGPKITMESAQEQAAEAEAENQQEKVERLESESETFDPQTAFNVQAQEEKDIATILREEAEAKKKDDGTKEVESDSTKDGADSTKDGADSGSSQRNTTVSSATDLSATPLESEIMKMQKELQRGREQDKWLAIAQAGLALMSSKEPTLLGAAGEAGISGLTAFREAQDRYQEGVIDLINARAKLKGKSSGLTAGNAVTRLNQVEKKLSGVKSDDGLSWKVEPATGAERQRLMEEEATLRSIMGYEDINAAVANQ